MKIARIKIRKVLATKLFSISAGLLITDGFLKLGSFMLEAIACLGISYALYYLLTLKIMK